MSFPAVGSFVAEGKGTKEDLDGLLISNEAKKYHYLLVWSEIWTTDSARWDIRGTNDLGEAVRAVTKPKGDVFWTRRVIVDPKSGTELSALDAVRRHVGTLAPDAKQKILDEWLSLHLLDELQKKL